MQVNIPLIHGWYRCVCLTKSLLSHCHFVPVASLSLPWALPCHVDPRPPWQFGEGDVVGKGEFETGYNLELLLVEEIRLTS